METLKIRNMLSKDLVQRIIYGLGLTAWIYIMWDRITEVPFLTSSLGINYLTLFLVPALFLSLQIIRNNQIFWGIIFGLMTTFILVALYVVATDAIERSGNHVKAIIWEIKGVIILVGFFGTLFFVDWIIYSLRPTRLI